MIHPLTIAALALALATLIYGAGPVLLWLGAVGLCLLAAGLLLGIAGGFIGLLFGWIIHPVYPPEPWLTLSVVGIFVVGAVGIPYAFLSPTSEWRNRKRRP